MGTGLAATVRRLGAPVRGACRIRPRPGWRWCCRDGFRWGSWWWPLGVA